VDVHETWCGGLMTIIFVISLFLSMLYCSYKSYSHKYDTITLLQLNNDLEKMGPIKYKDLNFMIFH
jgi:hypothetical protein